MKFCLGHEESTLLASFGMPHSLCFLAAYHIVGRFKMSSQPLLDLIRGSSRSSVLRKKAKKAIRARGFPTEVEKSQRVKGTHLVSSDVPAKILTNVHA